MIAYDPNGVGLDYILRVFIPMMQRSGISKEQITKISNRNAVCALTGA